MNMPYALWLTMTLKVQEKRELSDNGLTRSVSMEFTLMTYMMEFQMDGLFARLLTELNQQSLNGKTSLKFQRTTNLETHPTLVKLSKPAKSQQWDLR